MTSTPGARSDPPDGGSEAPTQAGSDPSTDTAGRSFAGDAALSSGTPVGRYVVLSRLGSGGMGVVYVAYDPDLDRKVALKILRRPIDGSAEKRARQLREAQALARLVHPNVVTVYDAGSWRDHTFLAMELVEGQTLSEWSRGVVRTWPEALDVILAAGHGVAAAHAANIVHRDLKPDNVMVADDGRVLVMDFGLATSLDATSEVEASISGVSRPMGGLDIATQWGARGTPGYMAPEQHAGTEGDERIDQFGFCVTAWQLVYGERPHPGDTVAQTVRSVTTGRLRDPPAGRRVPQWLRRILARGLQPKAAARWPTMTALLDALTQGQAAMRRRWIWASLGVAAVAFAVGAIHVKRQRDAAVQRCIDEGAAIAEIWPGEEGRARDEIEAAFAATSLGYGPDAARRTAQWLDTWAGDWGSARQEVCDAERTADGRLPTDAARACLTERRDQLVALVDSLREADENVVRRSIGAAASLPAVAPCLEPQALARMPLPPSADDADAVVEARAQLSRVRSLLATGRYEQAKQAAEAALAGARALDAPAVLAMALRDVGRAADNLKQPDIAEPWLTEAYLVGLAHGHDAIAAEAAVALTSVVGAEGSRIDQGRHWGAVAAALLQRLDEAEGLDAAYLDLKLARLDRLEGRPDAAVKKLERSLRRRIAILGASHPSLAGPRVNLANAHLDQGDYDTAAELFESAIAQLRESFGPDHPDTALAINNLGAAYIHRGDLERAEKLVTESLEIRRRGLSEGHPHVAQSLTNLGVIHNLRGDNERAAQLYREALEVYEKAYGPEHREVATALINVGVVDFNLGNLDAAERANDRARRIFEREFGPDHPEIAHLLVSSAEIATTRGDLKAARSLVSRAQKIQAQRLDPDHPSIGRTLTTLGMIELQEGDAEAAVQTCTRAEEILVAKSGPDGLWTGNARECLAKAREALEG